MRLCSIDKNGKQARILKEIMSNPQFEANISQYDFISILGRCCVGAAVVHLAKHRPSNTMVAVKKFDMDKIKEDAYLVEVHRTVIKHVVYLTSFAIPE